MKYHVVSTRERNGCIEEFEDLTTDNIIEAIEAANNEQFMIDRYKIKGSVEIREYLDNDYSSYNIIDF